MLLGLLLKNAVFINHLIINEIELNKSR